MVPLMERLSRAVRESMVARNASRPDRSNAGTQARSRVVSCVLPAREDRSKMVDCASVSLVRLGKRERKSHPSIDARVK